MKVNLLLALHVAQGRYGMNPGLHSFRNNVRNFCHYSIRTTVKNVVVIENKNNMTREWWNKRLNKFVIVHLFNSNCHD